MEAKVEEFFDVLGKHTKMDDLKKLDCSFHLSYNTGLS